VASDEAAGVGVTTTVRTLPVTVVTLVYISVGAGVDGEGGGSVVEGGGVDDVWIHFLSAKNIRIGQG
jgi:hypothetical protein